MPLSPSGIGLEMPLKFRLIQKKACHTACPCTGSDTIFLAVLVHFAHTVVKWNTNAFPLLVGVSSVKTDAMLPMKNEKKFMQMAVKIIKAVFSFMKEHGRRFHPKSLLSRAKSHSLAPRLLYVSIMLFLLLYMEALFDARM